MCIWQVDIMASNGLSKMKTSSNIHEIVTLLFVQALIPL